MVIEEKLEASSFLAIVVFNIVAMLLCIPSMVAVLKPILPGVKSRAITAYMLWKSVEILVCPFLDAYALFQSTEYRPGNEMKASEQHAELENELYNEEIYD